jgi:integrase
MQARAIIPSDDSFSFPKVSEVPAIQKLALATAYHCHTLGYDSIVTVLPQIIKSIRSDTSRRVYLQDIQHFASWLYDTERSIPVLKYEDMLDYYIHLENYCYKKPSGKLCKYSRATVNRMFAVSSKVLQAHVRAEILASNPCKEVETKAGNDETTHTVLTARQASDLLSAIDTSTIRGKRDYAMVSLMLRSGLRREECRMLNIGDIHMVLGHHVADIQAAKGGDRQQVKIAPDVWRRLKAYMDALQEKYPRHDARLEAPLFIAFRKGDHPTLRPDETGKLVEQRIDVKAIETLVKTLGDKIQADHLTPHGLRATFITLALEHDATLEQTQYAARHKDPRTTERYRKRKFNLDNNAVDKLSFLARDEEEDK